MLTRVAWPFLVLIATACGSLARTPTPAPSVFQTQIAHSVAATLTAAVPVATRPSAATVAPPTSASAPFATSGPIPTPAVPTSRFFTDARYVLADERLLGDFAIRSWRNTGPGADPLGFDRVLTIAQTGDPAIQVEFFNNLDPLTGTDLTGDGVTEVIVKTYTGGAHCCFTTEVYSLGDEATRLLATQASNCSGEFRDLDGDGILEYLTCDDRFAYAYCPFAASPVVTAVLAYDPEHGYVAASFRYPAVYTEPIATHTTLAEQAQPGGLGEWDATTKCAILPLVLDYLYSGQTEKAWSELDRLYLFPDSQAFREEIETTLAGSPLYVAP